jgi:hypothetical protein
MPGSPRQYTTTAGALLLTIPGSPRQYVNQEFNDPKYDSDISKCQVEDNLMPDNNKQLRDVHGKVYDDYKTALHYLALQRRDTKYYEARRSNFYHICIVMNEKRPTYIFLGKQLHVQMKKSYHYDKSQSRSIEPPTFFTRLFDEAYKNHYTNIKIEIERFAAHRTPLEYTQRHTPDITNLYYYIDNPEDGSAEQGAF